MHLVTGWLELWTRSIDDRALSNARSAATACSRRRLERAEVEAYLERHLAAVEATSRSGAVVHTSTAAERRSRAVH